MRPPGRKRLSFEDYDGSPEPEQIRAIYDSGFQGVISDPGTYAWMRRRVPRFYDVFPRAMGVGEGRLSLPYRACLVLEREFGRYEAQTTGDCVSHSTRNAGMIDYCIDAMFGETPFASR